MTKHMSFALEWQVQFLREKLSEAYMRYGEEVSQRKIVHDAKNLLKSWTLFSFKKGGA